MMPEHRSLYDFEPTLDQEKARGSVWSASEFSPLHTVIQWESRLPGIGNKRIEWD